MPRNNTSETREWTRFACILSLCLIVFLATAHLLGPLLVQQSTLIPTQTLRAQIHLLQSDNQNQSVTDVVILGDSTASRSLAAERIEKKLKGHSAASTVRSYGVSYGTLANSYTLLLRHIEHRPLPRCIVIMTSYGAARQHYGETFWEQMVDPNLFSYQEFLELYGWSQKAGDFPSTAYSAIEYKLKVATRILLNGFSLHLLRNAVFNSRSGEKSARFFNRALEGNGSFSFPRSYHFHADPEYHAYLTKQYRIEPLVDLILKKVANLNTNVLLLSTPISADFNTPAVQRWTKSHETHMLELLSKHKNVTFSLVPQTLPRFYFVDPTHLIADGAEKIEDSYVADIHHCLDHSP